MEGAFRAIERRLAQMNVFSHCHCLTLSANDCVFSLNEQQKVYLIQLLIIHYSASAHEFLKFYREREHTGADLNFLSQL